MVAGSPWNTLFWLVKQLDKHGTALKPDQVVITGAIGKFMDGKPGKYKASFSQLGDLNFEVED